MKGRSETVTGPFVMCVGAAALDLVADVETLPVEDGRVPAQAAILAGGGPAATAAVAIRRSGTKVRFVGSVGADDAGRLIREGLEREEVDVTHLRTIADGSSALSVGLVRSSGGTRTLVAFGGSGSDIPITPELVADAREAAWIHADHAGFGVLPELRRRGVTAPVSVDGGNPITDLDLALVDIYAPAGKELLRVSGASTIDAGLKWAHDQGVAIAVATHGETGSTTTSTIDPDTADVAAALLAARDQPAREETWVIRQPSFSLATRPGSTLGAGDVFHGALVAAIVQGRPLRASLRYASAAAALSCAAIDGRSAIPTTAEVDAFVESVAVPEVEAVVAWS